MRSSHFSTRFNDAFTLIELLVVIAIIAILSVVVILTLNPAQLLEQSRDSNRISDMSTLNTALSIYLAQGGGSLGNANTVYVSIPDPTATTTAGDQCQGLGLPSLPAIYSYQCAATSTYRATDGTGWIPINFSSLPAGSPLGSLPIDPINTSSSREYYTYDTNGTQYEVTMVPESQKYQLGGSNDVISNDGGTLASVYEKGNTYGLEPLDYGDPTLVGLWSFNEGTGGVAYDYSGQNATGSWSGTHTGTSGYYSPGKIGPWAATFDGSTNNVNISSTASLNLNNVITLSFWIKQNGAIANYATEFGKINYGVSGYSVQAKATTTNIYMRVDTSAGANQTSDSIPNVLDGNWHNIVFILNNGVKTGYEDGVLSYTTTYNAGTGFAAATTSLIFGDVSFSGLLDDVRIYNRALTAAQIAAMYAGGK
jgi:prepilin-type N-terminal cleavage/methylation domain-containing protein